MPLGHERRAFWLQAAAAAGATVVFYLWLRNQWGGDYATTVFADVAQLVVPVAAGWACLRRAVRREGRLRRAWRLAGAACVAWAAGQAVWSWYEVVLRTEAPGVSLADAGFLAFLPLAGAAILSFRGEATTRQDRSRSVIDALLIMLSLFFVTWYTSLGAEFTAGEGDLLTRTVNLAYPLGDTVLVAMVLFTAVRAPRAVRPQVLLVGGGIFAINLADLAFLGLSLRDAYETGSVVDIGWIMGFQLIGLAAVTPLHPVREVPDRRVNAWVALAPILPLTAAVVVAVVVVLDEGGLTGTLFWIALAFVLLAMVRQTLMLLDNLRLKRVAEDSVARLEEEKALRTQLLNNITHDLLSPLSPVRIQTKILADRTDAHDEKQRHSIEVIQRNIAQVTRLAEDLKDTVNFEAGQLSISPADVDLAALVRDAVASQAPAAAEAGVRLDADASDGTRVRADAARVTQVLFNLIGNAVKFTPEGGTVTVRVRAPPNPDDVRVEVQDTGRGLSADEMPRLFRAFSQVHERGEIKERGTGLGLYISKGIVEGHGGRIGVTSDGRGRGSTFWFTLPPAAAAT